MIKVKTFGEPLQPFKAQNELLELETDKGIARHLKTEILNKKIWYTMEEAYGTKPLVLDLEDVKKIIQLNKKGNKPKIDQYLPESTESTNEMSVGSVNEDLLAQEKKKQKNKRPLSKRPHHYRRKKTNTKF